MLKKFIYWLPALAWMAAIFYLSSRTGQELNSALPFLSNLNFGHVLAYFILAPLFLLALEKGSTLRKVYIMSFALSILYGISDEWHQFYVPSRVPDIWDLARDAAGALLGLTAVYLWRKKASPPELKSSQG